MPGLSTAGPVFDVLRQAGHEVKMVATKSIKVFAEVVCSGKTGVEMEALTAVTAACLTIYDMTKWMGQEMMISNVHLVHKSGGKSGDYNL